MGGIAPELAYITAKYAALAPFARVAALLSELLPTGGTANAGAVRSRHLRPERNFEIVAGKVVGSDGIQHRFAFARNGASVEQFARALVRAGVRGRTPATALLDGDTCLRNLQRRVLPKAPVVLN